MTIPNGIYFQVYWIHLRVEYIYIPVIVIIQSSSPSVDFKSNPIFSKESSLNSMFYRFTYESLLNIRNLFSPALDASFEITVFGRSL